MAEPKLKAGSQLTQAKDDWDEIKADIKQLVKELRSLAAQPQPQRVPEPEPEPEDVKYKVSVIPRPDIENSRTDPN